MVTDKDTDLIKITKDGHVTKRIIKAGVGKIPEKNDIVTVHYDSYIADTNVLFDSSRGRRSEFTFALKGGKVIEAWELVIPTMKVGEKAEIMCTSDYGYGDDGRQYIVPPKATLRFEVELLGSWEAAGTATERIKAAEKKKAEGNEFFKRKATNEALFAYKKAREYIKDLWNCEPEQLEECRFLTVALNLNIAACYLQLKNYDFAIEVCKRALDRDSSSVKAYYRLGQAYLETGDYNQGIQFVKMGLQYETNNAALKSLLSTLEAKQQKYINDSKKIYKKMCE
ncbi:GTPase activating protein (GAP) [Mucor velutinosus]|uniref:peptidylprolyl isomerase n=1 Tax=Mucor velutinosus TaxID=708070 RepID=A0AAN7DHB1_9FUNG|nr:GTPase activating protein (GAP) [Mucor velutinosus]